MSSEAKGGTRETVPTAAGSISVGARGKASNAAQVNAAIHSIKQGNLLDVYKNLRNPDVDKESYSLDEALQKELGTEKVTYREPMFLPVEDNVYNAEPIPDEVDGPELVVSDNPKDELKPISSFAWLVLCMLLLGAGYVLGHFG